MQNKIVIRYLVYQLKIKESAGLNSRAYCVQNTKKSSAILPVTRSAG